MTILMSHDIWTRKEKNKEGKQVLFHQCACEHVNLMLYGDGPCSNMNFLCIAYLMVGGFNGLWTRLSYLRAPHNSMPYIGQYISRVQVSSRRFKLRKDPFQKLLFKLNFE